MLFLEYMHHQNHRNHVGHATDRTIDPATRTTDRTFVASPVSGHREGHRLVRHHGLLRHVGDVHAEPGSHRHDDRRMACPSDLDDPTTSTDGTAPATTTRALGVGCCQRFQALLKPRQGGVFGGG